MRSKPNGKPGQGTSKLWRISKYRDAFDVRRNRQPCSSTHSPMHLKMDSALVFIYVLNTGQETTLSDWSSEKNRVSPSRQQSIPRLELQGVVLATRLMAKVRKDLNVIGLPVFYWTDSVSDTYVVSDPCITTQHEFGTNSARTQHELSTNSLIWTISLPLQGRGRKIIG